MLLNTFFADSGFETENARKEFATDALDNYSFLYAEVMTNQSGEVDKIYRQCAIIKSFLGEAKRYISWTTGPSDICRLPGFSLWWDFCTPHWQS
jgi:hypothetical protein